jgi:hypothetical protein
MEGFSGLKAIGLVRSKAIGTEDRKAPAFLLASAFCYAQNPFLQ